MKIAIIGTGISGLTCGYYLHRDHALTVYEANDYVGGHTATVDVDVNGEQHAIDTGFIVYNDKTYPNFIRLMAEIGVAGKPTEMSFSVSHLGHNLEYNGHTLSTLFAQKRNWFNPKFYSFVLEILRFNQLAKAHTANGDSQSATLGEFLLEHKFSDYFCENYILPMGAAIWSSTLADMRSFPLSFFTRFFLNHGLLDITDRPQWRVIDGGSRSYIEPLTRGFRDAIRLNSPVTRVWRDNFGVHIESQGRIEHFDQVIFACHSDQALRLLSDPSSAEQEILSGLEYQDNQVILHTDTTLLPKRRSAWAAWNYRLCGHQAEFERQPTLTYNMNILQHIESDTTFCVSLNSRELIDSTKILREFCYQHPVFTTTTMAAQQRRDEINGVYSTWFCGAYWYNGFHEDGVRSALDVVKAIELKADRFTEQGAA